MPSTETIAGVEVTRYIQSSFMLKADNRTVWIDPFRVRPDTVGADLADLVLVTHPHRDHLDARAIAACRKPGAPVVASPAAAAKLSKKKVETISLWEGESTPVGGIQVTALPGYNGLHPRALKFNVGFRFNLGGATIYHSGDTDAVPEMGEAGPVDVAFLPIGGSFVMNEEEAARAVFMVRPGAVVPMHYGYVTHGDPGHFARTVGPATQVVVLDPVLSSRVPAPVRMLAKLMARGRRRW